MVRRASMASKRLRTETAPKPSTSFSFLRFFSSRVGEREDVGRRLDRQVLALLVEILDLLLAEAFDVEGGARDEMAEMLLALERTGELAGAAAHDPLPAGRRLLAHHRRLQRTRADLGKVERLRALRAEREVDRQHLRDDVAGALHGDRVADADIDGLALIVDAQRLTVAAEAADVVLVVERRVLHDDAADGDRLQPRDGGQRAGAPDLDVDGEELRRRLLGRELVRDRPARRAGAQAEARLQRRANSPYRRRRRYRSRDSRACARCRDRRQAPPRRRRRASSAD